MTGTSCRRACFPTLLVLLALPAAAQDLPRVVYGTPVPQVLYGSPLDPAPVPYVAPPAAAAPPLPDAQTSLTYQEGPAYLPPPSYWNRPPAWVGSPGWHGPSDWHRPPRAVRPTPPDAPLAVSPDRGRYEQPLPQGRYVGQPPSAQRENPFQPRPWGATDSPVFGRGLGR